MSNKLSIFVKEELPTWGEMHEWYQHYLRDTTYACEYVAQSKSVDVDRYWHIPRQLFLMATICNQMNKMIMEDGYFDKIVLKAESFTRVPIGKIYFVLCVNGILGNTDFKIYSFQNPSENPFIMNSEIRSQINPDCDYHLTFVADTMYDSDARLSATEMRDLKDTTFKTLFYEVEKYFEEPIGWKDNQGNLISDRTKSVRCDAGADPAL